MRLLSSSSLFFFFFALPLLVLLVAPSVLAQDEETLAVNVAVDGVVMEDTAAATTTEGGEEAKDLEEEEDLNQDDDADEDVFDDEDFDEEFDEDEFDDEEFDEFDDEQDGEEDDEDDEDDGEEEDEPWDEVGADEEFDFESQDNSEPSFEEFDDDQEEQGFDDEEGRPEATEEFADTDDADSPDMDEYDEDMVLDGECEDKHQDCEEWAENGECTEDAPYMLTNCRVSCEVCTLTEEQIEDMIDQHEYQRAYKKESKKYFGLKQRVRSEEAKEVVRASHRYMKEVVMQDDRFESVRLGCLNRDRECAEMAAQGHCLETPPPTTGDSDENSGAPEEQIFDDWMETNCPVACMACHRLIFEERCPWNKTNEFDAFKPGDVGKMFERITTDPIWTQRGVTVHSRDPWVVTIDNFTTPEECQRLIDIGADYGYERSMDVGELQHDGTYGDSLNDGRTSTNAWCDDDCWTDELAGSVLKRIEDLTHTPYNYSEHLQLLRYVPGQYYNQHHDYIEHLVDRAEGVRVLTVFLYLNDVEEGGATAFPDLDPPIAVQPKRGRVLLWPSVLDSDPNEIDDRTEHEAQPVTKGLKYGANVWVHLRDFKSVDEKGCTS